MAVRITRLSQTFAFGSRLSVMGLEVVWCLSLTIRRPLAKITVTKAGVRGHVPSVGESWKQLGFPFNK